MYPLFAVFNKSKLIKSGGNKKVPKEGLVV
jgi:hypothetical protein